MLILPVTDQTQEHNNKAIFKVVSDHIGQVIDIADTGVGANTEFSVNHTIGYKASQVELLTKEGQTDAYLTIKPSGTAWTSTVVYLKCSSANAALRIRVS